MKGKNYQLRSDAFVFEVLTTYSVAWVGYFVYSLIPDK